MTFRGNGKHGGESSGTQRKPGGYAPPEQRKRVNRPTAALRISGSNVADKAVTVPRGNDPSPNQHSAKKVRKALDFGVTWTELDEVGNKTEDLGSKTEVANDALVATMNHDPAIQEEGEDGEIWWNEIIEEEEAEKIAEEDGVPVETQDSNEMQVDVSENVGASLDVEQFVDVEAKEVGKGKQGGGKPVMKKKAMRATAGIGGGPLRRMIQGAKTPRRKPTMKESQRNGEKGDGKAKEMERDPSEGSGTDAKAV
ncbi:unnamed protein product [Microthlaspi erraticum]|uniref:Uncharacterized protein n=1 Tax=Microthlaspi erraticum TaxID=1685480 RepID=A0A6D2IUJ0_9BRAS|nr:unnamed protein product [Microthlaspi erraticum]